MGEFSVRATQLGKSYRIRHQHGKRHYRTLREDVMSFFRRPLSPQTASAYETFWALRDISFEVKQGESVGIIGRNGAGKSTLLKILSRITPPTEGYADLYGRVGSLLEVGTGFHPELTGRENIFLSGAILGMSRRDLQQRFDEIVAFAEIEQFLDTPVKRYSSGMYMRLAFSVAAHLEPEILIVDEVLAVGDLEFQKKCLGKMSEVTQAGRTVFFVSHNLAAIQKLCTRAILLHQGAIVTMGEVDTVIAAYTQNQSAASHAQYEIPPPDTAENAPAQAHTLIIENGQGQPISSVAVGEAWQLRLCISAHRHLEHFVAAVGLKTADNVVLRTTWTAPYNLDPGEYQIVFHEKEVMLASGRYSIVIGLSTYERTFHYVEDMAWLEIAPYTVLPERILRVAHSGWILTPMHITLEKQDTSP